MKLTEAIKRPFQDLKTLVIGILVMIIPIVNITIGIGYLLRCAKTVLKHNWNLPKWEGWGDLFVKGLLAIIINLIYFIPALIILSLTIGFSILSGAFAGGLGTIPAAIAALSIGGIISLVVIVVTSLISSAALITYASKDDFAAAFDLGLIFKKSLNGTYFAAWVISMLYSVVIITILSFIPWIGTGIGLFFAGVTSYSILAEAYRTIK